MPKEGIHPTYYFDAHVTCACGNSWTTGSTQKEIRTDICSNCHPFYTGEQRIVDTAGQVERFMKKMENAAAAGARPSKRQQRLASRVAQSDAQKRAGGDDAANESAEIADEVATAGAEA